MADVTVIGRGAHVRGRVHGTSDLEIHGYVEGDVNVTGELVVEAHGLVAANLTARRLVVRGAVKGDLTAEEAVLLEEGARVVGDVRAPRVAISPGALVRGYVQTGAAGAASPRAKAQPAARPQATTNIATAKPAVRAAEPVRIVAHAPTKLAPLSAAPAAPPLRRGPPSPVVPALKKGAKGALKKRA